MKLQRNYFSKITFTSCLLLGILILAGCGKGSNQVNSSSLSGSFALSASPQVVSQVQNIKAATTCLPPSTRLQTDVTFNVSGNFPNGSTIGGNWQLGVLPGENTALFVGVSAWRDLMFVTKVTSGTQVVGYNVTLSFCSVANPAGAQFPLLVSNDRQLVNFMAPQGIVLDVNTYCGIGVVDAAYNTVITSQVPPSNQYSYPFTFPTSFTKPLCNGQF